MNMQQSKKYPRRPPRLQSIFSNMNPLFFITFNTHNRKNILAEPEIHSTFLEFCKNAKMMGMIVGNYVIMPDHIHLYVWCEKESSGLKKWIASMKRKIGKILSDKGIERPHWQEGFFDHILRNSESYIEKSEYISLNPVRAGLCKSKDEWPYEGKINEIYWPEF